jgi:hypothetical protein
LWIGIVHFFEIFSNAKYISLSIDLSLANDPRFFVTLRSDIFTDSMASAGKAIGGVVYISPIKTKPDFF